jgi:DNA-binding winged helix-turn-helix (wHTH) protein
MIGLAEDDNISRGRLDLRPATREVSLDGQLVAIGGRAFDVLHALASHAGHVVAHEDLLAQVWRGRRVESNNLQVQIAALRRVLGSGAIVTVPRRGYQLTWTQGINRRPTLAGLRRFWP